MGGLPLVGRDEELAYLQAAVDGHGGAIVGGAAGVGKTRLAQELASRFRGHDDWHVVWSSVTPAINELPLGGLAGLGLVDTETLAGGEAGLLTRLQTTLSHQAGGRRVLMVIDDGHLLDELSAAFIHQLVTAGATAIVLTVRTGEQPPSGAVSLYKDGLVPRLELQALGVPEFGALAAATVGGDLDARSLQQLWASTAGNVLFLRELVADAREAGALTELDGRWTLLPHVSVGPRLAELVADRMGRLQGNRRLLTEFLAVGEPLGTDLLGRLVAEVDLAEEERRGLIAAEVCDGRANARLAHPLFGEVIRSRMPMLQRCQLQCRLADAIEATGVRPEGDLLRLAIWRVESASASEPAGLVQAAQLARRRFNPALAARLIRAALGLNDSFEGCLLLGQALSEGGQYDEAAAVLDPLVGREPDADARQQLARERAWVLFHRPDGLAGAQQVLDAVEQAAESKGDASQGVLARADLALLLTYAGRFAEALTIGAPLIVAGVNDRTRLRSLPAVGACSVLAGRAEQVLGWCDELEPAAHKFADEIPRAAGLVWQMRTNALIMSGHVDQAVATLTPPLDRGAMPILGEGDLAYARTKLGRALLLQGRPATAATELAEAARVLRTGDPNEILLWCLSLAAEACALLGQLEQAQELAAEAVGCRAGQVVVYDGDAARARAWALAIGGEKSAAVDELVKAADDQQRRGQHSLALFAAHDALRLGEPSLVARVEELAATCDGPFPMAARHHATALVAGDPAGLDLAAEAFAGTGVRLLAAEAAAAAATLWSAQGLAVRAAASARARAAHLEHCEVTTTPAMPAEPELAVLTRREREVAALAAAGLTNAEIARRLVVSVRTVESHLYAVYGKLGVEARSQLNSLFGPQ